MAKSIAKRKRYEYELELQYQAWEDFVQHGVKAKRIPFVNPIIMASWKRCKSRGQSWIEATPFCLSGKEMQERKEVNKSLIEVAKPFLEELYEFVKGSGFVVVLLDRDACILEVLGDQDFLERYQHFRVGEVWDEETKGTNAMGVVKVEKVPLQVYAAEHYIQSNHSITCSGAPILAQDGEMIGILDVSGDYQKAHMHTLGMVVAAVKAIREELMLKAATAEVVNSYHNLNAIFETVSEGLISFNAQGLVTNMNPVAKSILGIHGSGGQSIMLKDILKNQQVVDQILTNCRTINNREFVLERNHRLVRFLFSGQPIIDNMNRTCGGVVVISRLENVHQLVNQMVGASASITFGDIIGESECLKDCLKIAGEVADSTSSVILQGESGTGKEMFAQAIHNKSSFCNGPFIAINCGAIPRDLIESELFGYEEGAFTGARRGGRAGKFELANEGTVFLDEICDMPLDTQVTLLRVLQEKQVVRIGGYKPLPINVRVIAATNKDIKEEVRKGNFREDLFYRLNVINISIPPLRQREGDVALLARYYLRRFSDMLGYPVNEFDTRAAKALEDYHWPGNVRELANAVERAVNLAKGNIVRVEHLPEHFQKPAVLLDASGVPGSDSLQHYEKDIILSTLESVDWNVTRASAILGIARNTLYRKLKKYGLKRKKGGGR